MGNAFLLLQEKAIDLCFMKGHELKKHRDLMIVEKRKIVTSLRYNDLKNIDSNVLKEVLLEAIHLYK